MHACINQCFPSVDSQIQIIRRQKNGISDMILISINTPLLSFSIIIIKHFLSTRNNAHELDLKQEKKAGKQASKEQSKTTRHDTTHGYSPRPNHAHVFQQQRQRRRHCLRRGEHLASFLFLFLHLSRSVMAICPQRTTTRASRLVYYCTLSLWHEFIRLQHVNVIRNATTDDTFPTSRPQQTTTKTATTIT